MHKENINQGFIGRLIFKNIFLLAFPLCMFEHTHDLDNFKYVCGITESTINLLVFLPWYVSVIKQSVPSSLISQLKDSNSEKQKKEIDYSVWPHCVKDRKI